MRPVVVVISDEGSPTVEGIVRRITADGGEAHVISARGLPRLGRVSIDDGQPAIVVGGRRIDLGTCPGIWMWHAERPVASDEDEAVARYVRREWELLLQGFAAVSPRSSWINHPSAAMWVEANKLEQARLARSVGFKVPPTLLSNDPDRIVDFAARFRQVAVKSQGGVWRARSSEGFEVAYTQRCTSKELRHHSEALVRAPVLVQPYLEKAFEVRVTVVDETAFFCRIDSQASKQTEVDWRRREDGRHVAHDLVEPAPDDLSRVVALVRSSGLRYAAIDLLITPGGETYFLDLNPSGQFGWIEALAGAPITQALTDALLSGCHC